MVFGSKSADGLFDGREFQNPPKSPLHRRVRRYVLGILVVNIALLALVQTALLQPSVERLENALMADDLARVENAIEQETKALGLKCREWSAWDDPYEVIGKPGSPELAQFVADNLMDEYFAAGQISLMAMIDPAGQVVWGEVHGDGGAKIENVDDLEAFFGRDPSPFFRFTETTQQYESVVSTRRGPMLLAARPQINSQFEGPIRGAFLMGRFLDARLTERLSAQTRVRFVGWAPADTPPNAPTGVAGLQHGGRIHVERDTETIDAYTAIGDDIGQSVYVANASIPRPVYAQARRFFTLMHGSIVVVSAVVFLSLGFALRRMVVRPIVEMKDSMRTISESKTVTERLSQEDDSEIGLLAADIHRLLDKTVRDMNFMQATEDALRRNEHILRLMAERTPSGFLLVDADGGRVLYHNRLFCSIWAGPEYVADEALCEPTLGELCDRVGEKLRDCDVAGLFAETLRDGRDTRVIDEEWALADGRTVRTYSTVLQTGDGTAIGRYYVFDDITARKRVEADLVRRGLLLEAVATCSNLLISSSDHPAAMTDALGILGTAVGATGVRIFEIRNVPGETRQVLTARFEWAGHDTAALGEDGGRSIEEHHEPILDALGAGGVIRGDAAALPGRVCGGSNESDGTWAMIVPVHVDARLWGFVRFDLSGADSAWTSEDDAILLVAAGSIGADIARKAYERKLVETVAELERMNRLMRGRENRVLELKAVINELHARLGERPRYTVPESYYGAEDRRVS